MHIHILGICGTFMGGLAAIARELGHRVTGSDAGAYPPMSTQLAEMGIEVFRGYDPANLQPQPELVIIGNALSRGNPEVEAVLERGLRYTSGAQWLAEQVLYARRWTLAVAGTHGKTTTASMLAWILECGGLNPGFLIGGVPSDFNISARLGSSPFFVIEADEYDTAFFDKRSKFVHYHPRTLVLNNLEYDHADIFPDLEAIKRQFHFLIRTVPASGLILTNGADHHLVDVLAMGAWTPVQQFGGERGWTAAPVCEDCSRFIIRRDGQDGGEVNWDLIGRHNMLNGLAAVAAACHAGVPVATATGALNRFAGVKRRLQVRGSEGGITVYDDFAHHPTAIDSTLKALRARVGKARIIAILEPRSNTMRMGIHRDTLAGSLSEADRVYLVRPAGMDWDLEVVANRLDGKASVCGSADEVVAALRSELRPHDHVLIMSNGGFDDIHNKVLAGLRG